MDSNHRSTGYEPVGISWLPHPASRCVYTTGVRFLITILSLIKVAYVEQIAERGIRIWEMKICEFAQANVNKECYKNSLYGMKTLSLQKLIRMDAPKRYALSANFTRIIHNTADLSASTVRKPDPREHNIPDLPLKHIPSPSNTSGND